MINCIIACGGSGGHLSPGIAIAEALEEQGAQCSLLISDKQVDSVMLKKYPQFQRFLVNAKPLTNGIQNVFRFVISQAQSFFECIKIIRNKKIDCVIGMGGFTNIPIVMAAFFLRKKIILHESNRVVGKTIKLLSYFADKVFLPDGIGFPQKFLNKKVIHTSIPIRNEISKVDKNIAAKKLGLNGDSKILTILGGSQGAEALNAWANKNFKLLNEENISVCCVQGPNGSEQVISGKSKTGNIISNLFLSFCDDVQTLLSATDLLICRAGASTIAEAQYFNLPMILVPYPTAADNHQEANARYAELQGSAMILRQSDLKMLTQVVIESFIQDLRNFKLNTNKGLVTENGYNKSTISPSEIIAKLVQKISVKS